MSQFITLKKGCSFQKGLAHAKKRSAYYEEGILLDVAAEISTTLLNNKITVSALAHRLNFTPEYLTKILRGHRSISLTTAARIAFAMGMEWKCNLIPINNQENTNGKI